MLETEFNYYRKHQNELVSKFEGKYLLIVGEDVVGVFESEIDAYASGQSKFALGTFLIQQCLPGVDNYTQTFHSRVSFAK